MKENNCWNTAECRHLERERSYHWREPRRNSHSYGRRSRAEGKEEELWKITERRLLNLKLLNKSCKDKRKCLYRKREREVGGQRKKKERTKRKKRMRRRRGGRSKRREEEEKEKKKEGEGRSAVKILPY